MPKGKILVVDDEPDIVASVSMRLRANGYEVVTAPDGLAAMEAALSEKPDVVILDVSMPRCDGHTVARCMRASDDTSALPIIFLSARTSIEDHRKAFDIGAAQYITKPFDAKTLLSAVEAAVSRI